MTGNIVTNPGNFKKSIQIRQVAIIFKTPPDCGRWFVEGLNLDVAKINKKPAGMTRDDRAKATAEGKY